MAPNLYPELWKLRLVTVLILSSLTTTFTNAAFAQIVPDGTLGSDNSRLTNGNVRGLPAVLIEGGATRGVNLFQSFLQFNVGDGQRVYFSNPTGIENILTRVTGSDPSKIFGTLGVNGGANLFLLNPNGIVFGPNARLDIAGSFLASTANSFVFENGLKFSATNPEAAPLITVNLRPGLQYGNQVGTLSNSGNLTTGQDLTLTGGNLDLQGTLQASRDLTLQATNTLKVRDSVANPFIAAAGGKLVVQGNQNVDIFALNHPDSGFFAGSDIVLRSANTVGGDAHYWAGGNFRIEQLDGELGNLFSPYDPIIRARGDVSFANYTGASLHILAGGSVTISGLVEITGADPTNGLTETITLSDGTQLNIDGQKNPTLDIRAGTTAFNPIGIIPNISENFSQLNLGNQATSADIKIGSIINTRVNGRVFLTNQYQPNTNLSGGSIEITGGIKNQDEIASSLGSYSVFAFGNPVTIDARSDVKIAQGIITGVGGGATGGDINILSGGSVELNPGGVNSTSTIRGSLVSQSNGNSGNITVTTANNILATGDITSQVVQNFDGNGGNIILTSKSGEIDTRGVNVSSKSSDGDANTNRGKAGNVTFTAAKDIRIGNIEASSNSNDKGFSTISVTSNEGSVFLNQSRLSTTNTGSGLAGDIIINALNDIKIENASNISSKGILGNIFIGGTELSPKTVTIDNSVLNIDNPGLTGSAGNISINAINNISIANSKLFSGATNTNNIDSLSTANAGNIVISASGGASSKVSLENTKIKSAVDFDIVNNPNQEKNITGNAGNITINAGSISLTKNPDLTSLTNGSELNTDNLGSGLAGNIEIIANNQDLTMENSHITSESKNETTDDFPVISLEAKKGSVLLTNSTMSTNNFGNKFAGDIKINAFNEVTIKSDTNNNNTILTQGNSGRILIGSEDLLPTTVTIENYELKTNNVINSAPRTVIDENAGDIIIRASGKQVEGNFTPGSVTIKNSFISSSTSSTSEKAAGNVSINIDGVDPVTKQRNGVVSLDNGIIFSNVESGGVGNGGEININAGSLSLTNGAQLQTLVRGQNIKENLAAGEGQGGKVNIDVSGAVKLDAKDSNTAIFSNVVEGAKGISGEINIKAGSLSLTNGAQINTTTSGIGEANKPTIAGKVTVNVDGAVTLDSFSLNDKNQAVSSAIFSFFAGTGEGNAGEVSITANSFSLTNGATINNSTFGNGNGGDITITTKTFEALNGGQVLTNTSTSGNAGTIKLNVTDNISLSGSISINGIQDPKNTYFVDDNKNVAPSGLFAITRENSTGKGGSINIDPNLVNLTNGAKIAVDSQGEGTAGNINLTSNLLTLNNKSAITSTANSGGDGGNVTFNIRDLLLLQGNSQISTSSGNNGEGGIVEGNGGSITINTPNGFIVAPPLLGNSDITANAFLGNGGKVNITAKGVFGLRLLTRQQLQQELGTSISTQLNPQNLPTNDITAISQTDPRLDGNVNINSPDVDPSKFIVSLPENTSDPSKKITQGCRVGEFLNTGRGGLPTRPDDSLTSEAVWEDLRQTATTAQQPKSSERATTPTQENVVSIIPATGWIFNNKGEVTLISHTHQANSSPSWSNSSSCPVR